MGFPYWFLTDFIKFFLWGNMLLLGMCTDPRHFELFGVRFEQSNSRIVRTVRTVRTIPTVRTIRTVRTVPIVRIIPTVRTVRTVRTIRTSCLSLLRSTYHGSHRLTRDAWFLYVWSDFLNTSLKRYFKRRD